MSNSNYDSDFYAWANEQAALLRAGRLGQADIEHIAQEIESMGRTESVNSSADCGSCFFVSSNGDFNRLAAAPAGRRRSGCRDWIWPNT